MKFKSSIKLLTISVVASAMFLGCSDDDSTPVAVSTSQTGTFIDAPVGGLAYTTATKSGFTNANGEFTYSDGEKVEFKLGNLSFGEVDAGGLITPYTMAGVANGTNSNISTNIALLLQNLDLTRGDGTIDVSNLQNFDFTGVDLSVTPTTMASKVTDVMVAVRADLGSAAIASGSQLSITDVQDAMNTDVMAEVNIVNDFSNLAGKSLTLVECSDIIGCESDATVSFTTTGMSYVYGTDSGTATVNNIGDGVFFASWDDGYQEYIKILSISSTSVAICWDKDTQAQAEACSEPDAYLVSPFVVSTFINDKEADMTDKLTGTTVTAFSEIQNKELWKLSDWNGSLNAYYVTIGSDGVFANTGPNSNYTGTFTNGTISITGTDDGDTYSSTSKVTKYDLSGKTLDAHDIGTLMDARSASSVDVTFPSGSTMYCHILYEECWTNATAMDAIRTPLGI